MVKDTLISAGKFGEITKLSKEAVAISLGFELAHLGINETNADMAMAQAETFAKLFHFAVKDGNSSTFAGAAFEILKKPYLGAHGHIAISTVNIHRAMAYLARKGVGTRADTAREKEGKLVAVYIDKEISGFAIHLLQK